MVAEAREVEGQLERHHIWFFVKTDAGRSWRLDVDERRVAGLLGLRVSATGVLSGGSIKVHGVQRA
jgi:hypothetical protein